jgi:predicted RNA-binding Zn ribbon-like protein
MRNSPTMARPERVGTDTAPGMTRVSTTAPRASRQIRDGFKFRTGHVALDLTATLTGRARPGPTDLLSTPADLDRWCVAAKLCEDVPGATQSELERAQTLREAVFRLARARVHRAPFDAHDVALVNRVALAATPAPQLTDDGMRVERVSTDSLLSVIARAGVELLGSSGGERLKLCEGAGCSVFFLDSSRAGERRWCSMAACGNRAKLAEFRARKSRNDRHRDT